MEQVVLDPSLPIAAAADVSADSNSTCAADGKGSDGGSQEKNQE